MNASRYCYALQFGLIAMMIFERGASADKTGAPAPSGDKKEEQAKQAFLDGKEAMRNGKHREALHLFHTSRKLFPAAGTTLNIALCEEQLGLVASAWLHFNELINNIPADDPRLPIAQKSIATLTPQLPRLQILKAANAPAIMTVTLDGEALNLPTPPEGLPIDPGPHAVRTKADRLPGNTYIFVIEKAGMRTLKIDAGARPQPRKPAPPGPTTPATLGFNAGIGASVVGFVGIGVGTIMGIVALQRADQASKLCPDPGAGCTGSNNLDQYWVLNTDTTAYGLASATAFLLGGVWATAGLVVLSRGKAQTKQLPNVIAAPYGAGVQVLGRF